MAVEVSFTDGYNAQYPAGSWTIDEDGNLHLVKSEGRGNVATVSKGSWQCVRHIDPPPSLTVEGSKVAHEVGEAINAALNRGGWHKGARK